MNATNLELPFSKSRPALTWLTPEPSSLVEQDRIESSRRPLTAPRRDAPTPLTGTSPVSSFTSGEIRSFQKDDAMAAATIGVVLGLAFLVLLTLVVGVSVWTLMVAG